jgi:hypothetical protein
MKMASPRVVRYRRAVASPQTRDGHLPSRGRGFGMHRREDNIRPMNWRSLNAYWSMSCEGYCLPPIYSWPRLRETGNSRQRQEIAVASADRACRCLSCPKASANGISARPARGLVQRGCNNRCNGPFAVGLSSTGGNALQISARRIINRGPFAQRPVAMRSSPVIRGPCF